MITHRPAGSDHAPTVLLVGPGCYQGASPHARSCPPTPTPRGAVLSVLNLAPWSLQSNYGTTRKQNAIGSRVTTISEGALWPVGWTAVGRLWRAASMASTGVAFGGTHSAHHLEECPDSNLSKPLLGCDTLDRLYPNRRLDPAGDALARLERLD